MDNRPSTDGLHLFIKKREKKLHLTHGTWHVTPDTWNLRHDMWHVTHSHVTWDTWHVTREMWHMVAAERSLKISAPQLLQFWIDSVLKILNKRINQWMNELVSNGGDWCGFTGSVNKEANTDIYFRLTALGMAYNHPWHLEMYVV